MKNRATSLISRLRDFLSFLAPLKSLEHTLVALEHCAFSHALRNQHWSSQLHSLLHLSPEARKSYPKHILPSFQFISLFHVGHLPPFSSAWVVIQMEFCQALTSTLAHRVWQSYFAHWGTSQDVTTFSASDTSNKFLPAPPQDCECLINLILQLFVQITCESPSPPTPPLSGFTAMQVNWPHTEEGADLQAEFWAAGKGWRTSFTLITMLRADLAAKFPPSLWCKSTQLPGAVSV